MKIVVAILNYNGVNWLEKFLPNVIQNSNHPVYVIDNASTDNSVEYLKTNFPEIPIVINDQNTGFAGGYNAGLKHIEADYYVLLNSDIEVTPNWIDPVIELIEKTPGVVAAQPKILSYNRKEYFEHAGAAGGMIDKFGYPFCRGRLFEHTEKDEGQYDDNIEIFWATGACMFIKADVYHEFKGFDDSYFAHMEEIDLCWRMKNAGHKIMYCGDSTVYHVGGGTLNYMSPRKTFLNFRNSLYTLYKNYHKNVFGKIFFRLCMDGLAGVKFLFSGDFKHILSIIKAHFNMYGNLGALSRKRKAIPKSNFSKMTGVYNKSIVWQHFGKKVKNYKDL